MCPNASSKCAETLSCCPLLSIGNDFLLASTNDQNRQQGKRTGKPIAPWVELLMKI